MWGPVKDYEADDTNNWSAVVSISYGTTSFLLTGDAEQKAEADMINAGRAPRLQVLYFHGVY